MPKLDPSSLGQHLDALYRAAWVLCGSREDAEDLVQETFVRVLAKPRTIQADGARAYLMQTLRNTFYSRLRTASRRPRTTATLDDVQAVEPRLSSRPDHAAEMSEIFAAIATLPEDFRLAVAAVDILGLSYGEAATALGTREATITTRLYRARQRIARQLGDEAEATARTKAKPSPAAAAPTRVGEGSGPSRSLA